MRGQAMEQRVMRLSGMNGMNRIDTQNLRAIRLVGFVCLAWIPATLLLDSGGGLIRQNLLGLVAWICLGWLLKDEDSLTRIQVAVVVVYATFIEYLFSDYLGAYRYRLHNVPSFVPPGHGLVYLA